MRDKYFLDTNVIIYSFDKSSPSKRTKARELIKESLKSGKGIVSYQVIQEFSNIALKIFKQPLKPVDLKHFLNSFLAPLCEVFPSIDLINSAVDIHSETGFGFYDSLIIASALQSSAWTLYSEDLNDGQIIRGVKIINPFR
jgi:predicted nucleic acid-binding protein